MTFFERYEPLAKQKGLEPCSQKAADLFDVTKAAISMWKAKGTTPKGDTVAIMADKLCVSTDYLLGRTEDPTDYATIGSDPAQKITPIRKSKMQSLVDVDPAFAALYARLDAEDRIRVEGVIQGMLMQSKYAPSVIPNAAHARTDVNVTDEMIAHDEAIMDDKDF